jgi:hypothetical protein
MARQKICGKLFEDAQIRVALHIPGWSRAPVSFPWAQKAEFAKGAIIDVTPIGCVANVDDPLAEKKYQPRL